MCSVIKNDKDAKISKLLNKLMIICIFSPVLSKKSMQPSS